MTEPVIPRALVRTVAQRTGLTHAAVQLALATALDEIVKDARSEKSTVFRNFGTFSTHHRPGMVRKSPTSGQVFKLAPRRVLSFKASKQLYLDPIVVEKGTAVGTTDTLPQTKPVE